MLVQRSGIHFVKSFWGSLLLVVLVACSPVSVVITPSSTANVVPTNTAIVPSKAVLPTDEISIPTPITPEVKTIVLKLREVKLSDLELSKTTRLILYYQPSESLRIMSGQDNQPHKIPNIASDAWIFIGIDMSPDHKWFIYEVTKGTYTDYWVSSVDGQEQKVAIPNARARTAVRWVTNEQIELWYYPDGARACPERESIINPFTQKTLNSPEVPPSITPQCFFDLSTNPDGSEIIYLNEDGVWSIYNFGSAQSRNVFPWLSKSQRFTLWPKYIRWSTNGVTLVIPREESVDFIVDLPIADISNRNVSLNQVLLPSGKKIYNKAFSWLDLDKGLLGFDLVNSDYSYADYTETSPSSNFMILDLKNSVLYEYNLDRANTGEIQKVVSPFVYPSADNRFLAWTIYEPPSTGTAIETVVFDRETGRIARIKGFEFYGWGEVNQP